MSKDKPNQNPETPSTTPKTASRKTDFMSVLSRLKGLKQDPGNRDYHEIIEDLNAVIQDFNGNLAKEIRDVYPGWTRDNFITLMEKLGEGFHQEPGEKAFKDNKKRWAEIDKLKPQLEKLEYSLMVLSHETTDFEKQVAMLTKNRDEDIRNLGSMNWLQKTFTKKSEATRLQEGIDGYNKKIDELNETIAENPKEKREAEKQAKEDAMRNQIEEIQRRLKELEA